MKRKLLIFVLAMFCLMLTVLGSAAYYTHDVKTHNVITSGNVKIELVELADEDGSKFEDIEGVMPSDQVGKIVMARNIGASDAWIRARLTMSVEPAKDLTEALDISKISLDIDSKNWTEIDGWYYYNTALAPGAETAPLMSNVSFDKDMDNNWQSAIVTIDVSVQAVQTANNGSTVFEAKGWPAGWMGGFWP